MQHLSIESMRYKGSDLKAGCDGPHAIEGQSPQAESRIRQVLIEKWRRKEKAGRRFFGEAFVTSQVAHKQGWYRSFQWLTSSRWAGVPRSSEARRMEFRAALDKYFPHLPELQGSSADIVKLLGVKGLATPDLWLIIRGEHHFKEVKIREATIRADHVSPEQLAGLAVIASCLPSKKPVRVSIVNLYSTTERAREDVTLFRKFCHRLDRAGFSLGERKI